MAAAAPSARSPLEKPLSELTEEDIAQVTREDCRRFLKDRGMRRPSWNKSQAIQQVISLKALLEGRPGAGDPPVASFLLPSHDGRARSSEKNETSGSGSGQLRHPKESLPSPYRRRDPLPPPPLPEPAPTVRCPCPCPPPPDNRPAIESLPGQLTIFYDGHISVYEGVSPDRAKTIMQLAESSGNHYPAPTPAHATRLQPPLRFPSSFPAPGPNRSLPSTSPTSCAFRPPSPTGVSELNFDGNKMPGVDDDAGGMKIPRVCWEGTEELRPPRENEPAEEPTTRKASLQRYLEKRKDRIKGKRLLGVVPGMSMDMMYMSHKSMWCHTSNEIEPRSPPVTIQCGSQTSDPTKVGLSFDLNDEAVDE